MRRSFHPSRPDGRSDRRVIYELVRNAKPGTLFTYDELIGALQPGLGDPVDRARAGAAARSANTTLHREEKRHLAVVPGEGYRVIFAGEHARLATTHQERAAQQIDKAITLVHATRLDEMTSQELTYHQGKLVQLSAVQTHFRSFKRRRDRIDRVIDEMLSHQQIADGAVSNRAGSDRIAHE